MQVSVIRINNMTTLFWFGLNNIYLPSDMFWSLANSHNFPICVIQTKQEVNCKYMIITSYFIEQH